MTLFVGRAVAAERLGDVEIILGDESRARCSDELLAGRIRVRSRHGLRAEERLLIEAMPARARNVLTILDGEGVVGLAAKTCHPDALVTSFHLDAYLARRARRAAQNHDTDVTTECAADLPAIDDLDTIFLSGPRESLLLRELIEEAHDALAVGGRLLVVADKSPAKLTDLVKKVFGKADRQSGERKGAQLVGARRTKEQNVWTPRTRVVERDVRAFSLRIEVRAGVFGTRGIDPGTRALAETMEIPPGARVIDIGCGTGVLGITAAKLGAAEVHFADSHARAVSLAQRNADANGVDSFQIHHRADLEDLPGPYDVALANPPYFADYRIAKSFTRAAHDHLSAGGKLYLVAKERPHHEELVSHRFGNANVIEAGDYNVFEAARR